MNRMPHQTDSPTANPPLPLPTAMPGKTLPNARRIRVLRPTRTAPTDRNTLKLPPDTLATDRLCRVLDSWNLDLAAAGASPRYLEGTRFIAEKLVWWLRRDKHPFCGPDELRGFSVYVQTAHTLPEGRWGEPHETREFHLSRQQNQRGYKPVSVRYRPITPSRVATYDKLLRSFFAWAVAQGILATSPMAGIHKTIVNENQIAPFSLEQLDAIFAATKKAYAPRRNLAILYLLADTGIRVSELCGLTWNNVDLIGRRLTVMGKGRKSRTVEWGDARTTRALWNYAQEIGIAPEDMDEGGDVPVFVSQGGSSPGEPMTRGGVLIMVRKMGKLAGITGVRCSPHTLRHSFSFHYMMGGGDEFSLSQQLGHTNIKTTARYVNYSRAAKSRKARQCSPISQVFKRKNG
jgi:integrase/recombinase XerC